MKAFYTVTVPVLKPQAVNQWLVKANTWKQLGKHIQHTN